MPECLKAKSIGQRMTTEVFQDLKASLVVTTCNLVGDEEKMRCHENTRL